MPWTLPLSDPAADVATVGGKGASLARLAGAGLPVPEGFHLTTAAYQAFTSPFNDRLTTADAQKVSALFTESRLPEGMADEVANRYAKLKGPVAVRSSATAEDLPDFSFAGQMESFLNVSGIDEVLTAIRACWTSLWAERAVMYRRRNGIDGHGLALAVVVQELVPAEVSGVMFTADPITSRTDRLVVNATWGLGESLVDGLVSGDQYVVDRTSGELLTSTVDDKRSQTVPAPTGTAQQAVETSRQREPALDNGRLARLRELADRTEQLYERPMDIEWAWVDEPYILQARPITVHAREVWNDTTEGDFLWTSANLGEAVPSVMTPATWALMRETLAVAMVFPEPAGHRLAGNIGGRLYLNYTAMVGTAQAVGLGSVMARASAAVFGKLPDDMVVPALPESRVRLLRSVLPNVWPAVSQLRYYQKNLERLTREYPGRCRAIVKLIESADSTDRLREIWVEHCAPLFHDGPRMLAAGSRVNGSVLLRLRPWLSRLVTDDDVDALMTGHESDDETMASLGPLRGLRQLADGEIDQDTYVNQWGHRCPDELELMAPRPIEDPQWVERQLTATVDAPVVAELLDRQRQRRHEALDRFKDAHPRKLGTLTRMLGRYSRSVRAREITRSESVRAMWVVRQWFLKAGEVTGLNDAIFFLEPDEVLAVLSGDDAVVGSVAARRAAYRHYQGLPVYPTLIRGRFDPETWAADPNRRTDRFEAGMSPQAAPTEATVTGAAGSPGIAEGTARVIDDVHDADQLEVGDVLVTKITNVGWTPIFPRAAGVVTDIGATLSHAAIVARELGIPAVVGTGVATSRIRSGDRIRIDGAAGTITVLSTAD